MTTETLTRNKDMTPESQIRTIATLASWCESEPSMAKLQVRRRTNEIVAFQPTKIANAILAAFKNEFDAADQSTRFQEIICQLTITITNTFRRRWPSGGVIHLEAIQDQVEVALMRSNYPNVAKEYILHRAMKASKRANQEKQVIHIKKADGHLIHISKDSIADLVSFASDHLEGIDPDQLAEQAFTDLYEGASQKELNKALTLAARSRIEKNSDYSQLAARLLRLELLVEVTDACSIRFDMYDKATHDAAYREAFSAFLTRGCEIDIIDEAMLHFDLEKLAQYLKPERDNQFTYLGLQTLYDRYFIHERGTRIELPQVFFMRVAMGLALQEEDKNQAAMMFYDQLSTFQFMSSTPTLFNAGTTHSQLSSCFLTTIPDSLKGIYKSMSDNALLSKFAGGLGNDWTPVRGLGSHIKGTNGQSQGIVPFLFAFNASAGAVNQGGKRKGAVVAYLESWHMDIFEFLDLRKNTGDERRRTHDMHTANWIPDLFMERVMADEMWTLFSPDEAHTLHDLYGSAFKTEYQRYEKMAERGEIRSRKIKATVLWRKMLSMVFETGHPWLVYKDPCNLRSPQQHVGVVHSSNLCTEITLNTSEKEVAVCNLGSINLPAHIQDGQLNVDKLYHTVEVAIRMLDNVIDINYYAIPEARNANMQHRPIGLGVMGFQDALFKMGLCYASEEAVAFADTSMEHISYAAIRASNALAKKKGAYKTFEGSLWHQGILPIDSVKILQAQRGEHFKQDTSANLDWDALRMDVQKYGMRNSNVLAIAPTATISNICGVSQSIEPTYQNLFVKSNMSGEFTVVNEYLIDDLKQLGLWDEAMINDLKYFDGSIQQIDRIPEALKLKYRTAFEIPIKWIVQAASRRQKWIDQAQSLNLYLAEPSGKKLDQLYKQTWLYGLKSTYYLRTMGATSVEKSTVEGSKLNAVQQSQKPAVCDINDPDCEACQ